MSPGLAIASIICDYYKKCLIQFDFLLRKYHQYFIEVSTCARQLPAILSATESVHPFHVKLCVDVDVLESTIASVFIEDGESYESFSDLKLLTGFTCSIQKLKEAMNSVKLDTIVMEQLRSNMKNVDEKAHMQKLFAS